MKKFYDPDKGCKLGEKACAICGKRGLADLNGDKPTAPFQYIQNIKYNKIPRWYCKQHQN